VRVLQVIAGRVRRASSAPRPAIIVAAGGGSTGIGRCPPRRPGPAGRPRS
jgi:hypothetical protein